MMKRHLLAAIALAMIAGCQSKQDVGTPSDAPLPPDPMAKTEATTSGNPNGSPTPPPVTSPEPSTEPPKTGG